MPTYRVKCVRLEVRHPDPTRLYSVDHVVTAASKQDALYIVMTRSKDQNGELPEEVSNVFWETMSESNYEIEEEHS